MEVNMKANDWKQRFESSEERNKQMTDNSVKALELKNEKIKELKQQLAEKEKQIADLQHRLKVAEKATKLACDELRNLNYRTFDNVDIDFEQQFKEQAEKEV